MTIDEVRAAAMRLDAVERAALAAELQASVEHPATGTQDEIDDAWLAELEQRSDDLRTGRVRAVPSDEVLASIRQGIDRRR